MLVLGDEDIHDLHRPKCQHTSRSRLSRIIFTRDETVSCLFVVIIFVILVEFMFDFFVECS